MVGAAVPTVRGRLAYYHLFAAQILALLGTGVATVALALLAYDLAHADAGALLGTALAIKSGAYVLIAPLASGFTGRLPRPVVLIGSDLLRALVALAMPFVTAVGEVFALIFVFQAASAVFTPLFQATIPELLTDEDEYAAALARARLAYELEGMVSPIVAAALLLVLDGQSLFFCTSVAFLASAWLIRRARLPSRPREGPTAPGERIKRGVAVMLGTPCLRGLVLLAFGTGLGAAMVLVNTVVLVDERLGARDRATAIGLAAYGIGAVIGTLAMMRLRALIGERQMMLCGAGLVAASLALGGLTTRAVPLLPLWLAIGLGAALAQAPYGVLIRRSAEPADKPSVYAAHLSLSHAAMVLAYPLAGQLGAAFGMAATFALLAAGAAAAAVAAARTWPPEARVDATEG